MTGKTRIFCKKGFITVDILISRLNLLCIRGIPGICRMKALMYLVRVSSFGPDSKWDVPGVNYGGS